MESSSKPRSLPGEIYDAQGIPIYPGDLLKSFHFTDRRRKKHYLYHTAVFVNGHMEMVPTSHLQPEKIKGSGRCWLRQKLADDCAMVIISGHGPGDCLDYADRPRVKRPANTQGNHQ